MTWAKIEKRKTSVSFVALEGLILGPSLVNLSISSASLHIFIYNIRFKYVAFSWFSEYVITPSRDWHTFPFCDWELVQFGPFSTHSSTFSIIFRITKRTGTSLARSLCHNKGCVIHKKRLR